MLPERVRLWAAFEPPDSRRRGRGLYGRGCGFDMGSITVPIVPYMRRPAQKRPPRVSRFSSSAQGRSHGITIVYPRGSMDLDWQPEQTPLEQFH